MGNCSVRYKTIEQYTYVGSGDYYICDEIWRELDATSHIVISPNRLLLLEINFLSNSLTNENYEYISSAELLFPELNASYNIYAQLLTNWSSDKPTSDFTNTTVLPQETSPYKWNRVTGNWLLSDSAVTGPVYMIFVGVATTEGNGTFTSDTGLDVEYYEMFTYPCSFVNTSIIDNYNNSFTVSILDHDFPPGSTFSLSYSRGLLEYDEGSSEPILDGEPIFLDYLNSDFDSEVINIKVSAVSRDTPDGEPVNFYYNCISINQYKAPDIEQRPKLSHVFYSKLNNKSNPNLILEPYITNEWCCFWETKNFNAPSKICGYIIKIYKNNIPVNLTTEYNNGNVMQNFNYCCWDLINQKLCLLDGYQLSNTNSILDYINHKQSFRFSTFWGGDDSDRDGFVDLDNLGNESKDIKYDCFYFCPADLGFTVGDVIDIEVQAYTRYGATNEQGILASSSSSINKYQITGITSNLPSNPSEPSEPSEPSIPSIPQESLNTSTISLGTVLRKQKVQVNKNGKLIDAISVEVKTNNGIIESIYPTV